MLSLTALRQAAQHYIQDNFDRVSQVAPRYHSLITVLTLLSQTKKFLSLDSSLLLELIIADELVVGSEELVWEAVLRWAAHNPSSEDALPQILTYIRYPLMNKAWVDLPFT